ncbi:sialoadhesin [Lates calcarifer]|uniref:Sialoadhesin n=1 Tax=Lates calcarifer TaxID=8187 RepID=A0AAJ8BGP0_LATCA|nr:sialoadhesin [Lates calcarifer]
MARALTFLLIGCLLKGALCGRFQVFMPHTIEVLSGSCVTIPCSFDIQSKYKNDLDDTCTAIWRNKDNHDFTNINPKLGHLTNKSCTTVFNNMRPDYTNDYYFRLECQNELKWSFKNTFVKIVVKADPPSPTLTPSKLRVKEGTSVSLKCSAPALCLSHPPTLTWTPGLGDSQDTLQETWDKTKVKTSVLNFTASYLHHRKTISCTATYNRQDGSTVSSVSRSLTAAISFPPQILHSSDCTKTTSQINCSCETVGNPSPILHWYLNGLPVNHSDRFTISSESLNVTVLRTIITVNQSQWRDLSTLVCHSSNSLGTASQRFCTTRPEQQTSAGSHGQVTLPVFNATVVALLVLVCILLFVIRVQRTHYNLLKSQLTGDTSTGAMSQVLTRREGNEAPNETEADIYSCTNVPSSGPNNAEKARTSTEKNEEGSDVIYSSVKWKNKNKKKKQDPVDMDPPGSSYLEEERCIVGGMSRGFVSNALEMGNIFDKGEPRRVKREVESEYAQVKFKPKSAVHK